MARKLSHALHIITGRYTDPHSTIRINNAKDIVHKAGTHWDEGHIGKRTLVLHHQLRDVQTLKTTRPTGNAMSPLHCLGSPNKGEQNQKWLPHPCILRGQKEGGNGTSPLHSRGSPNKGG